jgi:OTU domain-containing protein 6
MSSIPLKSYIKIIFQIELKALTQSLRQPIEVIQAEGRPVLIGEEFAGNKSGSGLVVTYHRHYFGLGEHYNSTKPIEKEEEEEQEE